MEAAEEIETPTRSEVEEEPKLNIYHCDGCSYGVEGEWAECKRCKLFYCPHYASKIDFQFCCYCMSDMQLHDSIIRKVIQTRSLTGKKTFTRVMRARHIMFEGKDWLFAQARILDMTDAEVAMTIEYHRTIFGALLNEYETRKIKANQAKVSKMMKNSTIKIPRVTDQSDGSIIGMDSSVVTEVSVRRTRVTATSTNSIPVALKGIINMLMAKGLTQEQAVAQLQEMAAKGGAK